jgi:hypothetical protein
MAQKKVVQKTTAKPAGPTNAQKIGVGVGLSAVAAAAVGAYFLYGSKSAPKNRKAVKSWALKAQADVLEKIENAQEMSQKEYEEIVKAVSGAYAGAKNASKKDLLEFTSEMKDHWKSIEKAAAPMKKSTKVAVKTVKKEASAAVKDVKATAKKVVKNAKKAVK